MLRINLLPIRQLKKRQKATNQIYSFVALFIIILFILGTVGFIQMTRVKVIEHSIAKLQKEKAELTPVLAKITQLEKTKKDLERKIEIVKGLKSDSSKTVHILDLVARKLDHKRMWLTSLKIQGNGLKLTGTALDNRTIAQFMDALKKSDEDDSKNKSPYIIDTVNLTNASLKQVSGRDLKGFTLACSIASRPEIKKKETPKKN